MGKHKYALRYTWIPETREDGYLKNEIENEDQGLCDALIGISILHPECGGYSQALFSIDGKEKRSLNQKEIFKAWLMLGVSLHDEGKLKGWQKILVENHAKNAREIIKSIISEGEEKCEN